MSSKNQLDALGNRMKSYEKFQTELRFMFNIPIYIRLDGRGFSKFTKHMQRPFDKRMSDLMVDTTAYLVKEFNAVIGYTQSDEISLILNHCVTNPAIFDGKIQKIVSTLAATASSYFCANFYTHFQSNPLDFSNRLPTFDARAFSLPDHDEATNSIYWRYLDCQKNAVSMAAHHHFSHKSLQNQNTTKMKDRLLVEAKVDFDAYPDFFKYGTFVQNQSYTKETEQGLVVRNHVVPKPLEKSFSLFTHDERKSFIF